MHLKDYWEGESAIKNNFKSLKVFFRNFHPPVMGYLVRVGGC
jgi:hypothetical protein